MSFLKRPRLLGLSILLCAATARGQSDLHDLEQEIIDLDPGVELDNYWDAIFKEDQTHRGLHSQYELDERHMKQVVLLIKHHGFPSDTSGASIVPGVVFTHQRSKGVRERYFPILHKGFLEGRTNIFWYLHVLRGMHRGRFGRDLIRGREVNIHDVPALIDRLRPWMDVERVDFDLAPLDIISRTEQRALEEIITNEPILRWRTDGDYRSIYKLPDGRIFFHVMYADSSCGEPQPMLFDPQKDRYDFERFVAAGDHLTVTREGALIIVLHGRTPMVLPARARIRSTDR